MFDWLRYKLELARSERKRKKAIRDKLKKWNKLSDKDKSAECLELEELISSRSRKT